VRRFIAAFLRMGNHRHILMLDRKSGDKSPHSKTMAVTIRLKPAIIAMSMSNPAPHPRWLLRRTDQAVVAALVAASLAAMIGWWIFRGGWQGKLIEIEQANPLVARFDIDINAADRPELIQLPGIGEKLAQRIIDSRQTAGPFTSHEDLRRVRGIGPKTLERIRPYLRPFPTLH
jgi:competence protein ComEA